MASDNTRLLLQFSFELYFRQLTEFLGFCKSRYMQSSEHRWLWPWFCGFARVCQRLVTLKFFILSQYTTINLLLVLKLMDKTWNASLITENSKVNQREQLKWQNESKWLGRWLWIPGRAGLGRPTHTKPGKHAAFTDAGATRGGNVSCTWRCIVNTCFICNWWQSTNACTGLWYHINTSVAHYYAAFSDTTYLLAGRWYSQPDATADPQETKAEQ